MPPPRFTLSLRVSVIKNKKKYQIRQELQWKARRAIGMCQQCGKEPISLTNSRMCVKHHNAIVANRRRTKAYRKESVLQYYGKYCSCCGESKAAFLTLDHIDNDGGAHRKKYQGNMYEWAYLKRFPPTLRVLCFNCNCGRAVNGGNCPHRGDYA